MASSDYASMAGYRPDGTQADLLNECDDPWDQNNCSARVLVDLQEGVKRVAAATRDPSLRLIGGPSQLQHYDRRLNLLKGDPAMVDTTNTTPVYSSGVGGFDGRVAVISSMLGLSVPTHINSESEWRASKRFTGVISQDTLIEAAKSGQAGHFGNAVYMSGLTGGSNMVHAVPEPIAAGQLLRVDIGPLDELARAEWTKSLLSSKNRWTRDAHKPVYRPYDPNCSTHRLTDGYEQCIADVTADIPGIQNVLTNPRASGVDPNSLSDDSLLGANMGVGALSTAWIAIVLAVQAGLVTPAAAVPAPKTIAELFNFSATTRKFAAELAAKLGHTGGTQDVALSASIVGATYSSFTDDEGLANMFDMARAMDDQTAARRLQQVGCIRTMRAFYDAFLTGQDQICGKAARNSTTGGAMHIVVM